MFEDILTFVVAVLFAVLAGFVARRILDTPVGWPRSIIVGLLIVFTGFPFASWVLDTTRILGPSGETQDLGTAFVAIAIIVLSLAWVFALGVAVLVGLEAIFPTRPLPNPIDVFRAAIKRNKRSRRYFQILAIASKHGAGWIFGGSSGAQQELTTSQQRAQTMVAAINESGVTFVKLGQVLSTRRDLIPEPYLSALASLQSGATALPWEAIRGVLEAEITQPLDAVFAAIDEKPLAAASVAQVHTAQLRDGTPVVVKVQRPAARTQVEADVDIVLRLAHRAETRTRFGRNMRLESVAHGFTVTLLDELDYRIEATNTEMLRRSLAVIAESQGADAIPIAVPTLYPEASTARVITMDLVDGVPLSRAASRLAELGDQERDALATGLMSTVIEQILVHGIFHADMHPGNVILRDDDTLGLIDFGAVGLLERSQRQRMTALLLAAAAEDDAAATDALLLIVDVPDDVDIDAMRHDVGVVLTSEKYRPAGSGSIFTRMIDVIREHRVALPGDMASAFRSFATLEGCLKVLVPDFDLLARALDVVPKILRRDLSLERTAVGAQAQAAVGLQMLRSLPRRLDALMTGLEEGRLSIRLRAFDEQGDQPFLRGIVSDLVSTLVSIAAVVIAVVLIVTDAGPVLVGSVTLFDLLGALIGFFGFLGLLRVVRQTFVRRAP